MFSIKNSRKKSATLRNSANKKSTTLRNSANKKSTTPRNSIKKENDKNKLINILDEFIVIKKLSNSKAESYFKEIINSEEYELSFKEISKNFSKYLQELNTKKVTIKNKYIDDINVMLKEFQNEKENKDDKNINLFIEYFNDNIKSQNGGASSNISLSNIYRYLLSIFQTEIPEYTTEENINEYNDYINQFKKELMYFYYPLLVLLLLMPDNIINFTGKITLSGKLFIFLYRKYTINISRIQGIGRRRSRYIPHTIRNR
jgi:hypothetical protein